MGNGHSILFFFLVGRGFGPNLAGLNGACGGGFGRREKNPVSKRAGFGPQAKTHGLGPGMEKPSPNPIRCHS